MRRKRAREEEREIRRLEAKHPKEPFTDVEMIRKNLVKKVEATRIPEGEFEEL